MSRMSKLGKKSPPFGKLCLLRHKTHAFDGGEKDKSRYIKHLGVNHEYSGKRRESIKTQGFKNIK